MAYLIAHFFEGGTREQYEKVAAAVRPASGLVEGESFHAAGPTEGGWLVVGVWESEAVFEAHVRDTLMPALQSVEGGLAGPGQMRAAETVNLIDG